MFASARSTGEGYIGKKTESALISGAKTGVLKIPTKQNKWNFATEKIAAKRRKTQIVNIDC